MVRRCSPSVVTGYELGPARGFTLVELMIAVVILGILTSIAVVGFRRYIARSRSTEAVAILAEMNAKENLYKLEFATFHPMRGDGAVAPSANELVAAFYPVSPAASDFDSARQATSISNPAAWPAQWRQLGLRPKATALYCTYFTNAGSALGGGAAPDNIPGAAGDFGQRLIGATTSAIPWFYSIAACNLSGASGFPDSVSVFGMSSTASALRVFNEGM